MIGNVMSDDVSCVIGKLMIVRGGMKRMNFIAATIIGMAILLFPVITLAGTVTPELRSAVEKVQPNEKVPVIITLTDRADLSAIAHTGKINKRRQIVNALKDKAAKTQGPLRALLQQGNASRIRQLWINNSVAALVPARLVDVIASFPGVESVKVDAVIYAPSVTPGLAATPEWNISTVQANDLWAQGITGNGVVVASMDTGVDYLHPDINGNWRGGTDSWFNPYAAGCVVIPGVLTCQACDLNGTTPCDAFGHGTGTVGIMTGGDVGGTSIGVAPGAQWIGVKIFADPVGTSLPAALLSAIHEGFQWVLAPGGDPARAPDIVNNSWGFDNIDNCSNVFIDGISTVRQDVQLVKDAGIAVVFAAGNDGPGASTSTSPANYPESFSVGATSISNTIASFSSRGPSACDGSIYPQISAPGVSVKTTYLSFGGFAYYTTVQGTSFAAPHVSGVMALLLDAFPGRTVPSLESAIASTATDLGAAGPDNNYGYGLTNAFSAYRLLNTDKVSVYRDGIWYIDLNANSTWDGMPTDALYSFGGGLVGAVPVAGDWDGSGVTGIGVYQDGTWYIDLNGNGAWDGTPTDALYSFGGGLVGAVPVTGDWDGSGVTGIGVYQDGTWYIDLNGNGAWDGTPTDALYSFGGGLVGAVPITGDWDGSGIVRIGIYDNGTWYIDMNNDGMWNGEPVDVSALFGAGLEGAYPLRGKW